MTLTEQLRAKLAFDGSKARSYFFNASAKLGSEAYCFENGAEHENARLAPIHKALIECVSALDRCVVSWGDYVPSEQSPAFRTLLNAKQALSALQLACVGELESNPESK